MYGLASQDRFGNSAAGLQIVVVSCCMDFVFLPLMAQTDLLWCPHNSKQHFPANSFLPVVLFVKLHMQAFFYIVQLRFYEKHFSATGFQDEGALLSFLFQPCIKSNKRNLNKTEVYYLDIASVRAQSGRNCLCDAFPSKKQRHKNPDKALNRGIAPGKHLD